MKYYNLITEQPNYDLEFVMEQQNSSAEKKLHAIADIFMINERNKNGRRYLEHDMIPAIETYKMDLATGGCVGELNHSSKSDVDMDRISHRILSIERRTDNPNFFKGKSVILPTAQGRTLMTLTESGVRWGFSSKCLGRLEESADDTIVYSPLVRSVDAVFEPSIGKFSKGILENKQFIISDDGKIAESYDILEKRLSKYPSKHSDAIRQHILESLQTFLKSI